MTTDNTPQSLADIAEPVCRAHGVELVQARTVTEHGGAVLRFLIDRPGSEVGAGFGVTIEDCKAVSRDLGPALEVHQESIGVGGKYRLEVSSPGLDRPLVKLADFTRFANHQVKLTTRAPISDNDGNERQKVRGKLLGVEGELISVLVEGAEYQIQHADIAKANVVHTFDGKG